MSLDLFIFSQISRISFTFSLEISFSFQSISGFSFVSFFESNVSPHLPYGVFTEGNTFLFLFDLNYIGFPLDLSIGFANATFNLYPKCFLQIISSSNFILHFLASSTFSKLTKP
jgi:hypothetical protein